MANRKKSFLKIPSRQMSEALRSDRMTIVELRLHFEASDVRHAIKWADARKYNYDDLADLLSQWALDGSPGAGGQGPEIDDATFDFTTL